MGGLLGHWAVWVRSVVEPLEKVHSRQLPENVQDVLALVKQITDSNAAFFDVANNFEGWNQPAKDWQLSIRH